MTTTEHEPAKRLSYSAIIERLTERRGAGGGGSVTIKLSAQGVVMPEVVVNCGADDSEVDAAVSQAVAAFKRILTDAQPSATTEKPKGGK